MLSHIIVVSGNFYVSNTSIYYINYRLLMVNIFFFLSEQVLNLSEKRYDLGKLNPKVSTVFSNIAF